MDKVRPVQTNQTVQLHIRDLGIHGEGIGEIDHFTVFVPGALLGETVTARIQLVKKSYAVGRLLSIDEASPDRVTPACPVYADCGGCQISTLTYEAQLAWKQKSVQNVVQRIGHIDPSLVKPVLSAEHPFGYRNKMSVPAQMVEGQPRLGFYRQGSHEIIPATSCLIQKEENNRLLAFVQQFVEKHNIPCYNEKTRKGSLRHVMGRVGDDGKVMAVLVTATKELPMKEDWIREMTAALPEVVSIYHNVQNRTGNRILGRYIEKIWGEDTLKASIGNLQFEVSPYSFFQVNAPQAENLYRQALEFANLTGEEEVIDAYCGTGTISLYLAQRAKHVLGIEIVPEAIADAKKNARRNHIENADFLAADAGKEMPRLYREGLRPQVIVVDPVRAGCSKEVLEAAAGMQPERIVYVSCNPATFARDARILEEKGYTVKEIQPVDMFPQTTHVETVVLMSRVKEK
jgi:23S rRNA (uracil1939-C5)-methyltransferase